jgi:TP901 family phage tail tape measure protein
MPAYLPIVSKFDGKGIDEAEGALSRLGAAATAAAAVAVAAVTGIAVASVREFAKFDSALNQSIAIMGDVSETMREDMSDAARQVAKETTFSAEQAAESFFFLASAGLDAEQSIAAMPQVAKFAQAGMFDMALATDLATDAQSALGLTSDDAAENLENLTRVTDVFVKANTLANTSVEQLATAFTVKAGNALKQLGKDVEEGAAVLALFADQGIKGEAAGTLLSNTLFGLTDRARESAADFKALGIEVFDAEGNMKNMADIADDFTVALSGMTTEQQVNTIAQLGFNKQARTGLLALLGNADAIREYEGALRDAGGTVEEVADKQLLTLTGQFELMKSAVSDIGIEIGGILAPILTDLMTNLLPIIEYAAPLFIQFFQNLAPYLQGAVDLIGKFGEGLGQGGGLQEAFGSFAELRVKIFDAIIEALPAILEGLSAFIIQAVDFLTNTMLPAFLDNFEMIATAALEVFQLAFPMIIDALVVIIPKLIHAIADMLPQIVRTIVDMIPTLLNTAVTLFLSLVNAVVEILPELLDAIFGMLPEIVDSVMDMLPAIITAGIELFNGLIQAVIKVLPQLITQIIAMLPVILDTIIEMLPELIEAGFDLFMGIVEGLLDALPEIIEAVIGMIPQIVTAIMNSLPKIIVLGLEIVRGLIKGIIDNAPRLIREAIGSLFTMMQNSIKDRFGIRSPSKVFAGYGSDMIDGLALGLESGAREVGDAVAAIGAATDAAFETYGGTINAEAAITGGLTSGMIAANVAMTPDFVVPSGGAATATGNTAPIVNYITVNAGMGADGNRIGEQIVNEILRFERSSGRVFARA